MSSPSLYRNLLIPQFGPSHLAMKHAGEAFDFLQEEQRKQPVTGASQFRKFSENSQ